MHVCICICTYKRAYFLTRLLQSLQEQRTDGQFTCSVVVCDNDESASAKDVVEEFAASSRIPTKYCVEPQQNISLARNRALEGAEGDFVACLDDDEFPPSDWLLTLFRALRNTGVDGVIGPVKPYFDAKAPKWVIKSRLYERTTYPTGPLGDWRRGRVNNILFKREILASTTEPFNPKFRAGEDIDFVRRMMENGKTFLWCSEAAVFEEVPAVRWRRTFILRRLLLLGTCAAGHPNCGGWDVAKSIVAVPLYLAALPISFIFGQDKFMVLMAKISYHIGKVLGVMGVSVIRDAYVVE
jgi:succinoglycan biosynthesis protein ExoM